MKRALAAIVLWTGATAAAAAQALPSQPVSMADGRVVVGGDVAVTVGPDDPGYFNYTDYERSALRELRLGMTASVRATERISVLGEIRSENLDHVSPFALYARIRPLPGRRLDVQVGRVPPTFGAFARRAYSKDNPLIGYPLAYQYLTSLRADAIPATVDELLDMRGRGWLSEFTVGSRTQAAGVPLVSAFRWDTGVQVSTGWRWLSGAASLTTGTPSNPRVTDDNGGKQIAWRVTAEPASGLVVGTSFSRGAFLSRNVLRSLPDATDGDFTQRAHGIDVEYSRDRWLARSEAVYSVWHVPFDDTPEGRPLRALAVEAEGRYTLLPGVYVAARAGRIGFNHVEGRRASGSWEAPVSRVEIGGGYYLQRNVIARVSWQHNARQVGRVSRDRLVAGQLLFWF